MDEFDDEYFHEKKVENLKNYREHKGRKVTSDLDSMTDTSSAFWQRILDTHKEKGVFTLKEIMDIPDSAVEGIYEKGVSLYKNGQYSQAKEMFHFCILADTTNGKYLKGMAATVHKQQQYRNAVELYGMCSLLTPDDPTIYYHVSDCYRKLENPYETIIALEMAHKRCGDNPAFRILKERIALALEDEKKTLLRNAK